MSEQIPESRLRNIDHPNQLLKTISADTGNAKLSSNFRHNTEEGSKAKRRSIKTETTPNDQNTIEHENNHLFENSDYVLANRIKNSEIIRNPLPNPLNAPFEFIDGTRTFQDDVKVVAQHLNDIISFRNADGQIVDDSGLTEVTDKERMNRINHRINELEKLESGSNSLKSSAKFEFDFGNKKYDEEDENVEQQPDQDNKILNIVKNKEPVALPNRNSTWTHASSEPITDFSNIYAKSASIAFSGASKAKQDDPQLVLDKKNEKKTAFIVDAFLLGYADMLCLTSSFLKDVNGLKKGPLMIPLVSLYLTDITQESIIHKFKTHLPSNDSKNKKKSVNPQEIEDALKKATFTRNRFYRIHLEYGVGDHVLRWDLEKDTKELMFLHKQLLKKSTKDKLDRNKKKDAEIPRFPVLPGNFSKIKGLFKGDKDLNFFAKKLCETTEPGSSAPENMSQFSTDIPENDANEYPESLSDSLHSVTTTLNRMSIAAINSIRYARFREPKEKEEKDKIKGRHRDKSRQQLLLSERMKLNNKYRDDMQSYFDTLIENVSFKEQSDKVLQFLELSPFSLLLSNEIYRKRKEGYMFIVSSASKQGWRVGHFRFHELGEMIRRHTSKWCVLGDSFLVYTSNILSTTPEEVFFIDFKTKLQLNYGGSHLTLDDSDYNAEDEGLDNPNDIEMMNDDDDDFQNPNSVLKQAKSLPTIKLSNSERTIKLVGKNPKITKHWALSISNIINESEWSKPHRFNSFAPVRNNAFAQWFVDARDYFYAASSAIEMAKDVIYIHDWWLSPELYLRRPANGNQNFRIDRLLERKAKEGVKIFVIVYRNVGNTVVTDSMYTKHSLLDLHENIYVLRSPNQIMQNVFFWAHHEKLLIVDHSVAFLGGIDLCFGRYDTPDHVLTDDLSDAFKSSEAKKELKVNGLTPSPETFNSDSSKNVSATKTQGFSNIDQMEDSKSNQSSKNEDSSNIDTSFQDQFQIFPGKDYSNPRKKDFFELTQPHEDMYDRKMVPRMPWHDVHMVTSGQVARDLSRHFIQRWNYLLRQKRPSRPTPLLVPPRPFTEEELIKANLKGTCEVQLLRSSCDWSLGLNEHEQSIQNAYVKCIEKSEHFVYIENQFFITSCSVEGTLVKNDIGNALVDRIINAHKKGQTWKAVIVIPLMPGFEAEVDTKEGGSVRLIMQCQYMSISMGETSIFARLKRVGIRPEDYIHFYSLRKWGLINRNRMLVTEQLYIHAKTMIVDDRIAIIGSANINERSMRGTRDSEVCAIVRDKDLIESRMDGKIYHVGKFSHSLRVRLMREHLGVDVDLLDLIERRFAEIEKFSGTEKGLNASVLKLNEGKTSLSAMVELGTRYLLGLHEGTPGFIERKADGNTSLDSGAALTNEMISGFTCIKNEGDDSVALDDIEFSFSFNHRAGTENIGLRSAKGLSSDTRVRTDAHRNEVRGDYDGYNSKYYTEAKKQINRFLYQKVNQCASSVDGVFVDDQKHAQQLPDYESILDVLSQNIIKDASIEQQNAINIDRWTMIKRLFYMKALYSKMVKNKVSSDAYTSSEHLNNGKQNHYTKTENIGDIHVNLKAVSSSDSSEHFNPDIASNVSLTKLSDDDIVDIDKNMLPQLDHEFLDPYAFEDPLDIAFFEGTWMTQAVRNTLLFQMVFHTQPDNSVQTWRDYKDFEILKKAFDKYEQLQCEDSDIIDVGDTGNNATGDDGQSEGDMHHFDNISDEAEGEGVEEHRRRLERSSRLAELERFQRNVGVSTQSNGVSRGTVYDHASSLRLMKLVRGHVVLFPARWMQKEVEGGNWFYKADKLPPIQIYD